MIFISRHSRRYSGNSEPSKGGLVFVVCLVAFLVIFAAFTVYDIGNRNNPGSWFCDYQIYQQKDGMYEVWDEGLHFKLLLGSFETLESAKSFVTNKCFDSIQFYQNHPQGKRVN